MYVYICMDMSLQAALIEERERQRQEGYKDPQRNATHSSNLQVLPLSLLASLAQTYKY
jgi:hypothetical protein